MERQRKLGGKVDAAIGGREIADRGLRSFSTECSRCAQAGGNDILEKQRYPRLPDLDDALVDRVKEREKWLITIIDVIQHFAPPRISAWGGVCSLFRVTEARGYDVDAEKYEGSGAQVGRKHPLFEPRGI